MDFNIQTYLGEMREEQRAEHKELKDSIGEISRWTAKHEVQDTLSFGAIRSDIRELQTTRTTVRWFIGIVVVALVGGVVEHIINHRGASDPSTPVIAAEMKKTSR